MGKYYDFSRIVIICFVFGLLTGCDVRRTMGIESKPSDEFVVSPSQKELELPPHFQLLPPQSGGSGQVMPAASPPEEALPPKKPLTPSEQEVIRQLGPGLGLSDQSKMDEDALKEEGGSQKKGLLGIGTQNKPSRGEILDPQAEEKRLQTSAPPQKQ